jgi:hypothetical protein
MKYYGPHKRYNYWYTGQNSEIISYEVNLKRAYQNDIAKTSDARINPEGSSEASSAIKSGINADTSGQLAGSGDASASVKSWLYSPGDLQQFKMRILGDPDYLIPTYSLTDINSSQTFYGPDFTIDPSQGQVFIEIYFNQVEDYDIGTGLLKPNSDIFYANYPSDLNIKGVAYMIREVTSTFSKGKFEQEIAGVLPEFAINGNSSSARKNDDNQSDAETKRLQRQNDNKPKISGSKSSKPNSDSDRLANKSRANNAAYRAKLNEKSKVVDDDATRANPVPLPAPTIRENTAPNPNYRSGTNNSPRVLKIF